MKARILSAAAGFDKPDITLGGTQFHIKKLQPMDGFRVLEIIRPGVKDALRDALGGTLSGEGEEVETVLRGAAVIVNVIFGVHPEVVEDVRRELWDRVTFKTPNMAEPAALLGREDEAFERCEPVEFYELLGRSLAVNFTASFSAVMDTMEAEEKDSSPPSKPAVSRRSSASPSVRVSAS